MIRLDKLAYAYGEGTFQLAIPDFTLETGEKVAVIGPSGSGKTTLLNLIAGILVPQRGRVQVDGQQVSHLPDRLRRDFRIARIGMVFQDFELLDYLSVLDNILHPYRISPALKLSNTVRERANELADQMGIASKLCRHVDELSQGEKQRAAICRALLPGPALILADEATGNLDPDNKQRILDLLFASVEQHGASLLAVTHDHELLPRFDRVVDFHDFHSTVQSG